jgi:Tfp pilus assembly protein PilO
MKGYWEQLRPLEKRMVVGIGAVLFVVINFWFVVPHFSDWTKVQIRMAQAQKTLLKYQTEIDQMPKVERDIAILKGEGLTVPAEDQIAAFRESVNSEAVRTGVKIMNQSKAATQTNQFFVEQSSSLSVVSKEQELVDFLFNLGSGNSLIRVRDLSLRPDPQHHELSATLKLVASYQKKPQVRGAKPATVTTPAPKTSPSPATKGPVSTPNPAQKNLRPGGPPTNAPAKNPPAGGKTLPINTKKT